MRGEGAQIRTLPFGPGGLIGRSSLGNGSIFVFPKHTNAQSCLNSSRTSSMKTTTSGVQQRSSEPKSFSQGAASDPRFHYCSAYAIDFQALKGLSNSRLTNGLAPRNAFPTFPPLVNGKQETGFSENILPVISCDVLPDEYRKE